MFAMIVQIALLIATAFILGCIIGCVVRRMFAATPVGKSQSERPASAESPVAKPKQPQSVPQSSTTPPVGKPAAPGARDNLKRIKGIGSQNEARLNEIGVVTFHQIADWSSEDQRAMGDIMAFPGRIEREEWVIQAAQLADGEASGLSRRVDSGSVTTSIGVAVEVGLGAKPDRLLLDAPRGGQRDTLSTIGGVGGVIETKMARLGIFHFDQIADMNSDELRWLDTALGFPGRAEREGWQDDARILAEGGTLENARKVDKGEILTSRKP